jgi:hypothetical protein
VVAEEGTDDPNRTYILIQRQFEKPDGGKCYGEATDEKNIGQFLLHHVVFTPEKLSTESDRLGDNLISVTFDMAVSDFRKASLVVKIISHIIRVRRRLCWLRVRPLMRVTPPFVQNRGLIVKRHRCMAGITRY